MEASIGGVHDLALKPKLLRSLVREYVPDDKHPFGNPSELSYVVSTVKTHKLLQEWAPEPADKDAMDGWKSAVDSWVNRLVTLVSSSSPDKCWAGICLLGVTCQECSSDRFLASYSVWINKLLSHIQLPVASHFVKAACCASLSDIFTRLGGMSTAKKDGSSQAAKIIQPALKLLNEDIPSVVLEEAICLLCTVIKSFPWSLHQHYDSVEAAIGSKLMSGKCSTSVLKKLGHTLSLLPKSRGDEGSWSLLLEKILVSISDQLNDAFQGLEEESKGTETLRVLLPSGKERPPPLGGLAVSGQSLDLSIKRPERLLESRISSLMHCCCEMLTSSYPVLVPVPIGGLVALTRRILMVDGSFLHPSYSFMTTLKQEFICSELPLLHLHSLEILMAVVKGLSSQLLPNAGDIARLLTQYLRTCKFPDLRIKAHSIMKSLLMSMGVGIAIHVSQDIINYVFIDLDSPGGEKKDNSSGTCTKVHADLLSESRQKKRKHSRVTESIQELLASDGTEVEILQNQTPLSVKRAALETLEALLTVGGSKISESWRTKVDRLLITVATDACKGGLSNKEGSIFVSGEPQLTWADFQLAALRALLASLLSPGRVRPPHLALGLELFRQGMRETGTTLAEYCGNALLSLEVLIHPRFLPLEDLNLAMGDYKDSNQKYPNTSNPSGERQFYTFQSGTQGKDLGESESSDDDLVEDWNAKDKESEIQTTDKQRNANYTETLHATTKDPSPKELPSIEGGSAVHVAEANQTRTPVNHLTDKDGDDLMVESSYFRNTGDQKADSAGVAEDDESEPLSKKIALTKSDVNSEVHEPNASTSENVLQTEDGKASTFLERMSSKGLMLGPEDELSEDAFPDIVDGDPDSD